MLFRLYLVVVVVFMVLLRPVATCATGVGVAALLGEDTVRARAVRAMLVNSDPIAHFSIARALAKPAPAL